jgi:hypothetical protein
MKLFVTGCTKLDYVDNYIETLQPGENNSVIFVLTFHGKNTEKFCYNIDKFKTSLIRE